MSTLRFETTLPSGHRLALYKGDITEEKVDAIVNAANTMLIPGGGVAGAIARRGGDSIERECRRIGRVETGSAAQTGAGRLPAKNVIHAVGPIWGEQSEAESDRLLASATTAALEIARQSSLLSIAFPAISSGIFGFPVARCASVMTEALLTWAAARLADRPRYLRFTIIDDETVAIFETELRQRFPVV
jgi:O-acetyl-ADP-ribose deacetylase (regulator of RNase III)